MNTATTFAPPYAIKCWVDNNSLFFELSSPQGPVVMSFRRSELGKATAILFTKFEDESSGEPYLRPATVAKALSKDNITMSDLNKAREALKAAGILKL